MICERHYQIDIRKQRIDTRSTAYNPVTGKYEHFETAHTKTGFGQREWFLCPKCKRRCAILYAAPNYACRLCHNLHYAAEHESIADRALRAVIKHRRRHGFTESSIMSPFPSKPHLMRWHTYMSARKKDQMLCSRASALICSSIVA